MNRVGVRAVIVLLAYLVPFVALATLGGHALDHGHGALGRPLIVFDVLSVFAVMFIGPAWVFQPLMGPPDDRPPRGRVIPLKALAPEQASGAEASESPPAAA